ncbi:hypothetical protein Bhyg_11257 [Pseudolycoriella hygida]|uniref:Uncharacterized protein n=1 Tax=Pseudolycoriella hygida TaxID=35572 RepID=A0A9Q0RZR9_9DIPT|nr:hypothetical protein Bhyg_11257 [Pseudolycoriella hygida]
MVTSSFFKREIIIEAIDKMKSPVIVTCKRKKNILLKNIYRNLQRNRTQQLKTVRIESIFFLTARQYEKKPEIYFPTRKQGHSMTVQSKDKLEKNSIERIEKVGKCSFICTIAVWKNTSKTRRKKQLSQGATIHYITPGIEGINLFKRTKLMSKSTSEKHKYHIEARSIFSIFFITCCLCVCDNSLLLPSTWLPSVVTPFLGHQNNILQLYLILVDLSHFRLTENLRNEMNEANFKTKTILKNLRRSINQFAFDHLPLGDFVYIDEW